MAKANLALHIKRAIEARKLSQGQAAGLLGLDQPKVSSIINGRLDGMKLDAVKHKRTDPYFTKEGPDGGDRGMNPYFHGRGIFHYDPAKHAQTKSGGGADFTVGARYAVGSMLGEATIGRFGGLAVFNRAITGAEMEALHESAKVDALK